MEGREGGREGGFEVGREKREDGRAGGSRREVGRVEERGGTEGVRNNF